jgi:hypothetical protein
MLFAKLFHKELRVIICDMFLSLLRELVSDFAFEAVMETEFRNTILLYSNLQAIYVIELYFDRSFYTHTYI